MQNIVSLNILILHILYRKSYYPQRCDAYPPFAKQHRLPQADISEKSTCNCKCFFLAPNAPLEPTTPATFRLLYSLRTHRGRHACG